MACTSACTIAAIARVTPAAMQCPWLSERCRLTLAMLVNGVPQHRHWVGGGGEDGCAATSGVGAVVGDPAATRVAARCTANTRFRNSLESRF